MGDGAKSAELERTVATENDRSGITGEDKPELWKVDNYYCRSWTTD